MGEKTIAYHLGYRDSKSVLNSAIPSYSNEFNDISPGKVLLYEILEYCKYNGDKTFDFGRGAEEYKYWFANDSSVLFHIKTYNKDNLFVKFKIIVNRIINKLTRILDV
jgi:CelD/BcsL family acetyltransferase involved in cellulose biosynthesis